MGLRPAALPVCMGRAFGPMTQYCGQSPIARILIVYFHSLHTTWSNHREAKYTNAPQLQSV